MNKEQLSEVNAIALAETLKHHGKIIDEMNVQIHSLSQQVAAFKQELDQQKVLIVKSLQQKYGTGSTA